MYCIRVAYSSVGEEGTQRSKCCSVPALKSSAQRGRQLMNVRSEASCTACKQLFHCRWSSYSAIAFYSRNLGEGSLVNSVFLCFLSLKSFLNFLCPKSFPSSSKSWDTLKVIGPHKFIGSGTIVRCGLVEVDGLLEGSMSLQGQI